MRMILATLLIGHGVAHVVGFAVPWKLVTSSEVPYRTTVAGGLVDIGPAGVRLVGLLWLLVAVAFVSVAAGVLQHTTWWYRESLAIVMVSFVLCTARMAGVATGDGRERADPGCPRRRIGPGLVSRTSTPVLDIE